MRSSSKGGMCSAIVYPTIICPLCNKSAFKLSKGAYETYEHFTKNGVMKHINNMDGTWSRKRG